RTAQRSYARTPGGGERLGDLKRPADRVDRVTRDRPTAGSRVRWDLAHLARADCRTQAAVHGGVQGIPSRQLVAAGYAEAGSQGGGDGRRAGGSFRPRARRGKRVGPGWGSGTAEQP